MSDPIEETTQIIGLALILGVALVMYNLAKQFGLLPGSSSSSSSAGGGSSSGSGWSSGATTPISQTFSGNPDDPGYNFFYGPDRFTVGSFVNWMKGKYNETMTGNQYGITPQGNAAVFDPLSAQTQSLIQYIQQSDGTSSPGDGTSVSDYGQPWSPDAGALAGYNPTQ